MTGLERSLASALKRRELSVVYQPIVALDTGRPVGQEALLRWNPPGIDAPSTSEFIRKAEDLGLIVPFGRFVLDRAAETAAQLLSELRPMPIAVNVSGVQLMTPGLIAEVEEVVRRYELMPGSLAFELTESVLISDFDTARGTIERLRELGFEVGLDDYGTGACSLAYVHRLPLDFLKIDRMFVQMLCKDKSAAGIVATVLKLAEDRSLRVVAEGIETESQQARLIEMGCQYGQGFLFGRPSAEIATGADKKLNLALRLMSGPVPWS